MDYDICDPSIRCGADKIGASVFLVGRKNGKLCRVLAYSQRDAEGLAREYSENESHAKEGPSMFDGF